METTEKQEYADMVLSTIECEVKKFQSSLILIHPDEVMKILKQARKRFDVNYHETEDTSVCSCCGKNKPMDEQPEGLCGECI